MLKTKSKILSMVLAIALAAIMCVPALANDATYSPSAIAIVSGNTYTYYSYIGRGSYPRLYARVYTSSSVSVPIGYMGARARMYSQAGSLASASDWSYNSVKASAFEVSTAREVQTNVYFYSKGQVQFYNGNGYTTYESNSSPLISLVAKSISAVPTNENGEVYGSEIFLEAIGVKADLISAIGENGVEGYVKATDLDGPAAKNPTEAVKQVRANRIIPLYESDGETVIGSFIIQNEDSAIIK